MIQTKLMRRPQPQSEQTGNFDQWITYNWGPLILSRFFFHSFGRNLIEQEQDFLTTSFHQDPRIYSSSQNERESPHCPVSDGILSSFLLPLSPDPPKPFLLQCKSPQTTPHSVRKLLPSTPSFRFKSTSHLLPSNQTHQTPQNNTLLFSYPSTRFRLHIRKTSCNCSLQPSLQLPNSKLLQNHPGMESNLQRKAIRPHFRHLVGWGGDSPIVHCRTDFLWHCLDCGKGYYQVFLPPQTPTNSYCLSGQFSH